MDATAMIDSSFQLDAKLLREKAERCFRLAKEVTAPKDAELLTNLGHEYLELAEKIEASVNAAMRRKSPKDDERG